MRIVTLAVAAAAATTFAVSSAVVGHAAPPKCDDLSGVLDGSGTCRISATDPAYTMSITYPVDYPDQDGVVDYVRQTRDGFLNVAKAPGPHEMPYELETTATEYSSALPPRGSE